MCHTTPNAYQVYDCLSCHAHNKTDMDNEHGNRRGYSYVSTACYGCHPNGR